jgi:hypothetical protein
MRTQADTTALRRGEHVHDLLLPGPDTHCAGSRYCFPALPHAPVMRGKKRCLGQELVLARLASSRDVAKQTRDTMWRRAT